MFSHCYFSFFLHGYTALLLLSPRRRGPYPCDRDVARSKSKRESGGYGSPPSRGRQKESHRGQRRESHHAVFAIRSAVCIIKRTPEPAPCGNVSTPFVTSKPSNGSSSSRSNSPSSQA